MVAAVVGEEWESAKWVTGWAYSARSGPESSPWGWRRRPRGRLQPGEGPDAAPQQRTCGWAGNGGSRACSPPRRVGGGNSTKKGARGLTVEESGVQWRHLEGPESRLG